MRRFVWPVLIVVWALFAFSIPSLVDSDTTLTAQVAAVYGPRTEDARLHDIAHERVLEIVTDFSHDGRRDGTAEVLAWISGGDDPLGRVVQLWAESPDHDAILADPSLTLIGCAEHVTVDIHWYACVLASAPVAAPQPTPAPVVTPAPVIPLPNTATP